jgi:RNA polymerase sigma factor (sigma-70 family)
MKPGLLDRVSVSPKEYLKMTGKKNLPDQSQITILNGPTNGLLFYRDSESGFLIPGANGKIVLYSGTTRALNSLVREAITRNGGTEGQLEAVLTGLSNGGGDIPWSNRDVALRVDDVYESRIWADDKLTTVSYVPHELFDDLEYRIEVEKAYDRLNCDSSFNQPFISFPEVLDEPRKVRKALKKEQEVELFLMYNYFRYRLNGALENNVRLRKYSSKNVEKNKFYDRVRRIEAWIADYNLALVMAMARRTRIPHIDYQELISEGNVALLRAINKFDVSRGFKFSTYACRAILKGFNRMATVTGRYAIRFGTSHDPELEAGNQKGVLMDEQRDMLVSDLREVLKYDLANLNSIEEVVIDRRFCLSGQIKKKTLNEVAKDVGLTTERIRQIQKKALKKLKEGMSRLHSWKGVPSMASFDD